MNGKQLVEILAYNIRRVRHESGYTQAKLAEMANITTEYMCEIENCRRWPGVNTFTALAEALNLEFYQLILPTTDSPYFDKHRALASFSQYIKASVVSSLDELCTQFMQTHDSIDSDE